MSVLKLGERQPCSTKKKDNNSSFNFLGPQVFFDFDLDTAFISQEVALFDDMWGKWDWPISKMREHIRSITFTLEFLHSHEYDTFLRYMESLEELIFVAFEPCPRSEILDIDSDDTDTDSAHNRDCNYGPARIYPKVDMLDTAIQELWSRYSGSIIDRSKGTQRELIHHSWAYHAGELKNEL